ncbi:MAG: cysteine desulfurase family protein [Pseudomonadota bacterium]
MTAERAYLDYNATAPLRPAARAAMLSALDCAGNPSSVHAEGRAARAIVERARRQVATLVGARTEDIIFTASGSEANAMALAPGLAQAGSAIKRRLVSAVEHPSVLQQGKGADSGLEVLPVDTDGIINRDCLQRALSDAKGPALVSVMAANNETGVMQPIDEVADIVHKAGGILHVDAVQTVGRVTVDSKALGADLITLSAHKLGGPKGVGALVIAPGRDIALGLPLVAGGGQERNRRAGTENVAGIAGFGAAAEEAGQSLGDWTHVRQLRDRLEADLLEDVPEAVIFGRETDRLPNTICIASKALSAETALISFDLSGVAVSSGSACSSGKVTASHVLVAMGVAPDLAGSAVRISLGWGTTDTDIALCRQVWREIHHSLSRRKSRAA